MECSDQFSCYSCKDCGLMAVVNAEKGIWSCRGCGNTTRFAHLHMPYATKLLLQELETMSIGSRIITQQKLLGWNGAGGAAGAAGAATAATAATK